MTEKEYRDHPYVANSDLKRLSAQFYEAPEIKNLDEIFSFGTLVHALILEPEKADYTHKDILLGLNMRDTFMDDKFCRAFVEHPDFVPEKAFFKEDIQGIQGKVLMDGSIKSRSDILEFKSLAVTSENAFKEAIFHFHYDSGASYYMDVSGYDRLLIAAVSKKQTKKLFKLIITRDSDIYKSGLEKYTHMIQMWKELLL